MLRVAPADRLGNEGQQVPEPGRLRHWRRRVQRSLRWLSQAHLVSGAVRVTRAPVLAAGRRAGLAA